MVGSRDSISACNVVLNTITAEVFKEVCDRLEKAPDFELAVHDLIKEYATCLLYTSKQWVGTCLYQEECKLLLINCRAVIRL